MSITINGATNTLTAASGLTIAGNTAVTGTLSASGLGTFSSGAFTDSGALQIGADIGASSITNATRKFGAITTPHYTNAQEKVVLASVDSNAAATLLNIGGGSSSFNSPTAVYVYAQAAVDTGGGSVVGTFSSTGLAVTGRLDLSAASSGQIKFPATQNASADANTLDDYEEGTWTPAIGVNGFNGAPTPSGVSGAYTKVGRLVTVSLSLTFGAGTYPSTYCVLTGLPFTPATDYSTGSYGNGSAGSGAVGGTCQATTASQIVLFQSTPTTASITWFATVTYHV